MTAAPARPTTRKVWSTRDDCDLDDVRAVVEEATDPDGYPDADRVERGVLFSGDRLAADIATPEGRRAVQAGRRRNSSAR